MCSKSYKIHRELGVTKMKCFLDKDINKCPYFLQAEDECISKSKCSFQEKIDPKIDCGYVRKEHWYEKYYKKS